MIEALEALERDEVELAEKLMRECDKSLNSARQWGDLEDIPYHDFFHDEGRKE